MVYLPYLCVLFFFENILSVRISRLQVILERGINTQYPIAVLLFFKYLCDVTNGLLAPVGLYHACVYSRAMIM